MSRISTITRSYFEPCKRITTDAYIRSDSGTRRITALWDTGATASSINCNLAQELKLPKITENTISGVFTTNKSDVFIADIFLSEEIYLPGLPLTSFPNEIVGVDLIIGMNVISQGELIIKNENGTIVFLFSLEMND